MPPASRLSSIQTTFHLNTCHGISILHPSRFRKLHPNSILVTSHRIQVSWCAPQLNPGHISAPPRCRYLCFTSIQVTSNLDPGHEICIAPPKRFPLTCIQVAGFASQLHPCPISLPYKSENLHLNSIHVLSLPHLHPGISSQSRSKYLHLTSIQVMSIVHPGLKMCITHPSRSCLTCIQIPISLSHLHPCTVSLLSRSEVSCLICILVTSHLQPTHFHSSHDICITAPSISYLTPIRVSILAPELHPYHVSPPPKSHDLCLISIQVAPQPIVLHFSSSQGPSQPHPGLQMCVSPPCPISLPFSFLWLHLPSIPIVSHLHPGHAIFISPPSRSGLISIQVARLAAQLHPCSIPPHPGRKICILPPSISCLTPSRSLDSHHTFIQVRFHLNPGKFSLQDLFLWCRFYFTCIQILIFLFHLYPYTVSPPSRSEVSCLICIHVTSPPFKSWYLHHSSIHVLSRTNPRFDISAWTPSRSRLTSIQVSWLAFHIHPSRSPTPSCCITIPARSHLNPIEVSGCASHLHPCPGSHPFSFL